jgi:hypothetical protein
MAREADIDYTVYSEDSKDNDCSASGNLFSPKIFSEMVQKGLKFFFHLKGRVCEVKS